MQDANVGERTPTMEQLEAAYLKGALGRRAFLTGLLALGALSIDSAEAIAQSLDTLKTAQARNIAALKTSYDYIVCGGGSAACALVGRLAADRGKRILMIEAGGWDDAASILDPGIWFTNFGTPRAWSVASPPAEGVAGRSIMEVTGRVLGGGSSINAMVWSRPFKDDFDYWEKAANDPKWGYEHALEIFRRIENWQGTPDARYRGKDGPIWCQPAADPSPLATAMLDACRGLGLPVLDDANGRREETGEGFSLMNQIIRDGRRQNIARSCLYPVLAQDNVTLLLDTRVNRVVIENGVATGVEFTRSGAKTRISARRDVILSTGGISTPHLLMLSGVGDRAQLGAAGIKTLVHSPEVGRNLQDHILHGACLWESPKPVDMRNSGTEVIGYLKSDKSLARSDISLVQVEMPFASEEVTKAYSPTGTCWGLSATMTIPKSRGEVRLRSANPDEPPVVQPNFLDHPDDLRALTKAIEMCRKIGNAPEMKPFAVREVAPGRDLSTDELIHFARIGAGSYSHASGTCRMGADAEAVVDANLRVNGVRNLRIADSSIMPRIPASATMAPSVLIGERMAEILQA